MDQKEMGGARMHLEQLKEWEQLREWIGSREAEDGVFVRLHGGFWEGEWKGCRIGRKRELRDKYGREVEGWVRQQMLVKVCERKVRYHRGKYHQAQEHSWEAATKRLRAAKGKGGSVLHEAFKIVKQRKQAGVCDE